MTMEFGTVSHRSSVLSVTLDRALETFSLADRGRVNLVACLEDISLDLLLYLVVARVLKTELLEISSYKNFCLVELTLSSAD
jgi:hypothetical protein